MKDGFIKVAAVTPEIRVADPIYNKKKIIEKIAEAEKQRAVVVVFPELCITGYSCGDLFFMEPLLEEAKQSLIQIAADTAGKNMIVFVGLPVVYSGRLYNVAAALAGGQILGLIPKRCIPGYNEFYETRHFAEGMEQPVEVTCSDGEPPAFLSRKPVGIDDCGRNLRGYMVTKSAQHFPCACRGKCDCEFVSK